MAQKTILLRKHKQMFVPRAPSRLPPHEQVCDYCGEPTNVKDEIRIDYFVICPGCYTELMQ